MSTAPISLAAMASRKRAKSSSPYAVGRHAREHMPPQLRAKLTAGLDLDIDLDRLRETESQSLLVHLVDVSDASGRPDPVKDFEVIVGELSSFGAALEAKPMLLVASKCDVANKTKLAKLKRYAKSHGLEFFPISGSDLPLTWAQITARVS